MAKMIWGHTRQEIFPKNRQTFLLTVMSIVSFHKRYTFLIVIKCVYRYQYKTQVLCCSILVLLCNLFYFIDIQSFEMDNVLRIGSLSGIPSLLYCTKFSCNTNFTPSLVFFNSRILNSSLNTNFA